MIFSPYMNWNVRQAYTRNSVSELFPSLVACFTTLQTYSIGFGSKHQGKAGGGGPAQPPKSKFKKIADFVDTILSYVLRDLSL